MGGARKKTNYQYVAVVQGISGDREIELMGMKSLDATKKKFVLEKNDEFVADFSDIVAVLPDPELKDSNGTEIYFFNNSIDVKEI